MHARLKTVLKIAGGLAVLVVLLYTALAAYVHLHKKQLLVSITAQLNEHINGRLTIEDMEPTLLRGLPGISVTLSNVLVRDSLWQVHGKDLLRAKDMYVSVDVLSLVKGAPRVRDISINNAAIYIFTDSTGYSNTSLFVTKKDTTKTKNEIRLNHLNFNKVTFVFENHSRNKLFQFDIDRLRMELKYTLAGWNADVSIHTFVNSLAFNTVKGSFIKGKRLDANLSMKYDKKDATLSIPKQRIKIEQDNIDIGGQFFFARHPTTFVLNISSEGIAYKTARALLSQSISTKLGAVDFKNPVAADAMITGRFAYPDTPLVKINWLIKDNICITPAGDVHCSLTGSFVNEVVPGNGHTDANSMILVRHFEGSWEGIPFRADTMRISNLTTPVLEGRFSSKFPLLKLNPVIGGNTFSFNDGTADLDLLYKGGVNDDDTTPPYVYGTINVRNAGMTYLPRDLSFSNVAATLKFMGSDLFIQNVRVKKGSSVLNMDGSMLNFFKLYYYAPGKMWLDWNIKSPQINLDEFKTFLSERKRSAKSTPKLTYARINRISTQLDKALDESNVHMQLQVGKVLYKRFIASDVNAEVNLTQNGIALQNISLKHAGGSLKLTGNLQQQGTVNTVSINTTVSNVNVKEFFYAFNNFGQETITDKNIQGLLSTQVNATGKIMNNGQVLPKSFAGTASFELKNGALKEFKPLMDISKFIFRNRHLEYVTFNTIQNKFDINGDKITIYPMRIESSAMNMNVAGVYAISKGTDIRIDAQLRNPKKDELIEDADEKKTRSMKGLQVHLQAIDGDDGKVNIKLKRNSKAASE